MIPIRNIMMNLGLRRPIDIISLVLIFTSCGLFIHTTNLKATLDQIESAPSSRASIIRRGRSPSSHSASGAHVISVDLDSLSARVEPPINITAQAPQQDLLVFTKINRCGSTTMGHLLRGLSTGNRFGYWSEKPYRTRPILPKSTSEGIAAVKEISAITRPAAIVKAISYIDFSIVGAGNPIYVSMIRDPIEQANSWFHWMRAPFAVVERALAFYDKDSAVKYMPKPTYLKKSYMACIESGDPECGYRAGTSRVNHPTRAFCTGSPFCPMFGSRAALEMAKQTVEKNYAVVGVLEQWDDSLAVMEKYIPRFFTGASKFYQDNVADNKTLRDVNFYKPAVKDKVRNLLRDSFAAELEFYEFVKQRLHRQLEALKSS